MMKRAVYLFLTCIFLLSFAPTSLATERVYRGVIKYIGYDLNENRMRVDVFKERPGDNRGRGQLYFENEASRKLAELIHEAFINNIRVEVWVYVTDPRGRANVIHTVNFSKVSISG